MPEYIVCQPKSLPKDALVAAAKTAETINPLNHAPVQRLTQLMPDFKPTPEHLAVVTTKYWGTDGVHLTVGFLDNPATDLRKRILEHMNAWASYANVVLTPIEEGSLWGTTHADPTSIMCYQIPGSITKDGQPIIGGTDIDKSDQAFIGNVYPKRVRRS
jgi:hypothetical protein